MFIANLIIYAASFVFIWFGSGMIVSSTSKFSRRLRLSSFAFSFVFLGLLTSMPEFSVGLQALADKDPQIFIGNLLGGIVVLFLVVIPLLAIFGNGISLKHELDDKTLLFTLGVILAPSLLVLDGKVSTFEGIVLMLLYLALLYIVEKKKGIFDANNAELLNIKAYSYKDILKVVAGLVIVFVSSSTIVDKTLYFADFFRIPSFYISLVVIALGTDLPELSLAVRSVISGKKDVAMGDYIGAAAASTVLFGLFTVMHDGETLAVHNYLTTFLFIVASLSAFYMLSRTKKYISRTDGFILVGMYAVFVILEFLR